MRQHITWPQWLPECFTDASVSVMSSTRLSVLPVVVQTTLLVCRRYIPIANFSHEMALSHLYWVIQPSLNLLWFSFVDYAISNTMSLIQKQKMCGICTDFYLFETLYISEPYHHLISAIYALIMKPLRDAKTPYQLSWDGNSIAPLQMV